MERLECSVQNYAWGAIGTASFVGRLLEAAGKVVDEKKPYAEVIF